MRLAAEFDASPTLERIPKKWGLRMILLLEMFTLGCPMLDKLWKQEVRKQTNKQKQTNKKAAKPTLTPPSTWHPALRHLLHIVHKPKGAIFHKNASSVMLRFPPDGTMDGVVLVWCSWEDKKKLKTWFWGAGDAFGKLWFERFAENAIQNSCSCKNTAPSLN